MFMLPTRIHQRAGLTVIFGLVLAAFCFPSTASAAGKSARVQAAPVQNAGDSMPDRTRVSRVTTADVQGHDARPRVQSAHSGRRPWVRELPWTGQGARRRRW